MNQGMIPGSDSGSIEDQVRSIIEKKGSDGWIRVSKCEKEYEKSSQDENSGTVRTRFYRWFAKVEKRKVPEFQVIKFPNNLSYIGLTSSNPKKLDFLVANDKKILQKLSFSDTFYSNAFKKLDEICGVANGRKGNYANPEKALLELNSFIATLPRELKEKVKPLQDQALDSVEKYAGEPLKPRYRPAFRLFPDEVEDKGPDIEFQNTCYSWVLKLVDEISSLLHESKDNLTLFGLNQADDKSKEKQSAPS
jgi:hypothetical protein